MISIYASTKYHDQLHSWIQTEDRLSELVQVVDYLKDRPLPNGLNLVVKEQGIAAVLDWENQFPPYLLPEWIPFKQEHLLGLVFAKLNNYEKCHEYLAQKDPNLYLELDVINRLQQGVPIDPNTLPAAYTPYDEYRIMHNQAIIRHFGNPDQEPETDKIKYFYLEALVTAPHHELQALSAWHFASFLLDRNELEDALRVVQVALPLVSSPEGKIELLYTRCQIWLRQLTPPYDPNLLEQVKSDLWEAHQFYQQHQQPIKKALVLTDMGIVSNYSESWSESLKYYQEAIQLFEEHDLEVMAAQVQYRKGTLLYTWAKNGNPQFFRPAAESYQEAVKFFNRKNTPDIYAEIQNHLGTIYAEIPDEENKKGLWAAISSSAFQEAFSIYQKSSHPYEYAMVCNHYANALLKYPDAKLSNNIEKALFYYQEALEIRTAADFPMERSLTLLNYLEGQWNLGMEEDQLEKDRFQDMWQRAEEVIAICPDPELLRIAQNHLDQLEKLKIAYTK